jgi:hypothetical protein
MDALKSFQVNSNFSFLLLLISIDYFFIQFESFLVVGLIDDEWFSA